MFCEVPHFDRNAHVTVSRHRMENWFCTLDVYDDENRGNFAESFLFIVLLTVSFLESCVYEFLPALFQTGVCYNGRSCSVQ